MPSFEDLGHSEDPLTLFFPSHGTFVIRIGISFQALKANVDKKKKYTHSKPLIVTF